MSKKWIFVALVGLLIVPLFAGCDAVAPEVKTLQTQVAALIEWKATAQADINTAKSTAGALSGQVNSTASDIQSLRSQVNNLPANNSYTKAEVDAKMAAIATDYAAKIAAAVAAIPPSSGGSGSGSGSGSGGTVTAGSTLLSTDGDLELWLRWVDPNKDLNGYNMRFGSSEAEFALTVKNKSTDSTRKFSIEIRFSPDDDVTVASTPEYINDTMGDWALSRTDIASRTKNTVTLNTLDIGRISRNTSDNYNLRLQLNETAGSGYWKVKFYITQEDDDA